MCAFISSKMYGVLFIVFNKNIGTVKPFNMYENELSVCKCMKRQNYLCLVSKFE